jgi:hypothetical protein
MLFILDANCPKKIAEGLDILEQGNRRSLIHAKVRHITKLTVPNASDEEVIKLAGKNKAILITYDKGFKTNKHRYKLYKEHYIGVILFHSFKDVVYYWDIVKSFVSRWEELKSAIKDEQIPFLYEISTSGFRSISIDEKSKEK